MSKALDNLERDASLKTQGAVDEGKRDVQEATSVGGSYLGTAIDTVKVAVLCPPKPSHLLTSASLCIFRVISHPASLVLLEPALTPRRSKASKRNVYIILSPTGYHVLNRFGIIKHTVDELPVQAGDEKRGTRDKSEERREPKQVSVQRALPRGP